MPVRGCNLVLWHRNAQDIKRDLVAIKARGYDTVCLHHTRYVTTQSDYPIPKPLPAGWYGDGWIVADVGQDPVHPYSNTPHPALVRYALAYGKRLGLTMIDKPALNLFDEGSWQGFLTIKDVYQSPPRWDVSTRFFSEYWLRLVKPEMEICRSVGASLCLGVEMRGWTLEVGDVWLRELVVLVRKAGFRGPLLYAANHGDEALALLNSGFVEFCLEENPGNRFGVDLYTPLSTEPTYDPIVLLAGAQRAYDMHRDIFALAADRALLTEFSYPAIPQAAVFPWGVSEAQRPQTPDYEAQTACFRAWSECFGDVGAVVWQAHSESGNDQHDISSNPEAESIFLRG